MAAREIVISGRVQGVGFRPFVHRLATRLALTGDVRNLSGQVLIHVEGDPSAIAQFEVAVINEAPRLARPEIARSILVEPAGHEAFHVAESRRLAEAEVHLPPDQSLCPDCSAELDDPADRRAGYPFINCTACGPRYTIIADLPYDRPATSMAGFTLCDACRAEYEQPSDRRFHAEPLACGQCGPSLTFKATDRGATATGNETSLAAATEALRQGLILAVKGIGGYHLMCDAAREDAVALLRERKRRPRKPLAVMFPLTGDDGLDAVRRSVHVDEIVAESLLDPARPIVLVHRRHDCPLSPSLAPGLGDLGVLLPYGPLHHLLLKSFGSPLVATSGNISGEPVLTDNAEADARLGSIADAFLHHDRPILRPADDPVVRVIAGEARAIRLGRGTAPLEVALPEPLAAPLLAVGGQGKVTVALGVGARAIVSPHIGDLDTPRGYDQMVRVATDLRRLYRTEPAAITCDLHPGFVGTRWARSQSLRVIEVQHHKAHASALAVEHAGVTRWLMFTWDGVGYGDDKTLWGGEALIGQPGDWRRVASFRPFRPPGGDAAARAPWRSAAGMLWEAGEDLPHPLAAKGGKVVQHAWRVGINAPATSAVGRIFDAAAALVIGAQETSYEGEAAIELEHLAACCADHAMPVSLPLSRDADGIWRSDWAPLLGRLTDGTVARETRALQTHATLAGALVDQVKAIAVHQQFDAIGLTGGVFQNRLLSEMVFGQLAGLGYRVELPCQAPANDGGLSLGQIAEANASLKAEARELP